MIKKHVSLKRELGFLELTLYGIGVILGAGIYVLIGQAIGLAGNNVWLSFVIAAIIASFTALSYAELVSLFPKSGAESVFAREAFSSKFAGFLLGWSALYTGILSVSTVALGFAGYFSFFSGFPVILIAISLLIVLSIINFVGIRESTFISIAITLVEAAGLLILIFLSIPFFGKTNFFEFNFNAGSLSSAMNFFNPVFAATALIFFAYLGFEEIPRISEETKKAKSIVPKALIVSLIVSTIIYIIVSFSVVSIVSPKELANSSSPLALVASKAGGNFFGMIISIAALVSTLGTVLVLLISNSRLLYGMADDKALPSFFAIVHKKFRTPHFAVLAVTLAAIVFVFIKEIALIASLTNFGLFLLFFAMNIAVIFLRIKKPLSNRSFRIPFSIKNIPITSVLGAVFSLLMMLQFFSSATIFGITLPIIVFGIIMFLTGIPAYLLFCKNR